MIHFSDSESQISVCQNDKFQVIERIMLQVHNLERELKNKFLLNLTEFLK